VKGQFLTKEYAEGFAVHMDQVAQGEGMGQRARNHGWCQGNKAAHFFGQLWL
jgi:hypothetical protein